jgi:hypothetical protein
MQTKGRLQFVFGRHIRAIFKRVLPVFGSVQPLEAKVGATEPSAATVGANANAGTQRAKRFKRTTEEIRLGLTAEQAKAARVASETQKPKTKAVVEAKTVQAPKHDENKTPRFRRTKEEIRLGLSIEDAAARRKAATEPRTPPSAPKRYEPRPEPAKKATGDLIETLSPRIQVRARAVSRFRASGQKGVISAEMLDAVERAVAAGQVTRCPPFVDSDGYDHLNQREVK